MIPHSPPSRPLRRLLQLAWLALVLLAPAWAEPARDITLQGRYWIDATGSRTIEEVAGGAASLQPMDRHQAFALGPGALWLRFELPAAASSRPRFLLLSGAAFLNRASLFAPAADGWHEQEAGDHRPVGEWDHPNATPLFELPATAGPVWLRLQNQPAPTSPYVQLLDSHALQVHRQWTHLLVGTYLGFGLLVGVLALIHRRLYGDPVFTAYFLYVACMLLFQLAFTGVGGLLFWPGQAAFNDAAPAVFMLLMTAAGIWFVRGATALPRHGPRLDRAVVAFARFGFAFPLFYVLFSGSLVYAILNLYGLLAVTLSISLCLWTWRRGEAYSWWLFLGFLPVHLAYPLPALRAAGLLGDSWATQYAVLIGSAIEIPVLLYVLYRRAKDFSENHARMQALESTDPLTGLTLLPVLQLRLRDALRRARRGEHRCTVLLVDVVNHGAIAASEGREAGDRALVFAASRLTAIVRDVDTVCRVADTRFAMLLEGPQPDDGRRLLAQQVVARGLERLPNMPPDVHLRLRVVTAWVPDGAIELSPAGEIDVARLLQRLHRAMDRLLDNPRRVVYHIGLRAPEGAPSSLMPA